MVCSWLLNFSPIGANGPINLALRGTNRRTVTVRVTSPVEENFTRVVRPGEQGGAVNFQVHMRRNISMEWQHIDSNKSRME